MATIDHISGSRPSGFARRAAAFLVATLCAWSGVAEAMTMHARVTNGLLCYCLGGGCIRVCRTTINAVERARGLELSRGYAEVLTDNMIYNKTFQITTDVYVGDVAAVAIVGTLDEMNAGRAEAFILLSGTDYYVLGTMGPGAIAASGGGPDLTLGDVPAHVGAAQ